MLVAVWRKKTCSIQFSLKNRVLNFRGVFLSNLVYSISEIYLLFSKKQKHLSRKIFGLPQITGSNQILFFKLCISQGYVHNFQFLEGKNSVCIGVKNFTNL